MFDLISRRICQHDRWEENKKPLNPVVVTQVHFCGWHMENRYTIRLPA